MTSYHGWTHAPKEQGGTDPIPAAAPPRIEYFMATSTTDLGTSETSLDFSGSGVFESALPTFDINASGNLEIFKAGVYEIELWETAMSLAANVTTVSIIRGRYLSGEQPNHMFGGGSLSVYAYIPRRIDGGGTSIDTASLNPVPDWSATLFYQDDTFGTGTAGPSEIEFRAYHEEDRVGVATTFATFRLLVKRLGLEYIDA